VRLYKIKDLRDEATHDHAFQIINSKRIWCASPASLNDPNEFKFELDYQPTIFTENLLAKLLEEKGTNGIPILTAKHAIENERLKIFTEPVIADVINRCRETIGVTSFSKIFDENILWDRYGGYGNGIAIEVEIPDEQAYTKFHHVDYVESRCFHVDVFLEAMVASATAVYRNILCTKTSEWAGEQEVRYLHSRPNVNVKFEMAITNVILGNRVTNRVRNQVSEMCNTLELNLVRIGD
jgi:hypothetical protein